MKPADNLGLLKILAASDVAAVLSGKCVIHDTATKNGLTTRPLQLSRSRWYRSFVWSHTSTRNGKLDCSDAYTNRNGTRANLVMIGKRTIAEIASKTAYQARQER